MKRVIDFLKQLKEHNYREWFIEHKQDYIKAQERFNNMTQTILDGIRLFDESVTGLTVKDCTYRIYRDVRFSKDKSPYKTHMGAYICPGGKKSGFAGYYFHVGIGGHGYPDGHMLAVGDYMCEPKVLKILREDIMDDGDFFLSTIKNAKNFILDDSFKMKKIPKGVNPDSPWAEFTKYKVYCLFQEPDNSIITSDKCADWVIQQFKEGKTFLDFINRAVQYVKDGNE